MLRLWFYDTLCQTLNGLVNIGLQHAQSLELTLLWTGSVGPQAAWRLLPHCRISLTLCHLLRRTVGFMQTATICFYFLWCKSPARAYPARLLRFRDPRRTHSAGLLWTRDRSVAQTDIGSVSWIQSILTGKVEGLHDLVTLNRKIIHMNTLKNVPFYLRDDVQTAIIPYLKLQ